MVYKRLGDLLMSVGLITQQQLDKALELQRTTKKRLGTVLVEYHMISEQQLIETLEMQLGVEFIDLSTVVIPTEMAQVLSKNIAKKYGVVPVKFSRDELYLAMEDPLNFVALEAVKSATRRKVTPLIATHDGVERAIMTLYGNEGAARAIEEMKRESGEGPTDGPGVTTIDEEDAASAPTVRLVNSVIERAATERASDIHLEPREGDMVVRMRIDGLLHSILTVPRDIQSSVISRIKIMGAMDIAERKVPQDGRANVRIKGQDIDLRISTLPTIFGEKIVIRLLTKDTGLQDAQGIGLTGRNLELYNSLLQNASGVVLIAGPTGSGKSSTMYTMVRQLSTDQVNLVTLEDPVEYNMDGVNQVQINEKTGMTFASGLRAILRQDPDIIAVGEIRDGETGSIAMRAAITGHLVLSTIHTNDSVSTIDRFLDIGVEPYLIAGALKGVISQRLVRRICPSCRKEYLPDEDELAMLKIHRQPDMKFYRGEGCPQCFHTGYYGRTGVFEILTINQQLREKIAQNAPHGEVLQCARQSGFSTMLEECRRMVLAGVTTVEEAFRVVHTTEE